MATATKRRLKDANARAELAIFERKLSSPGTAGRALKAASTDGSTFDGYAGGHSNLDRQDDIIHPGCLGRSAVEYLKYGGILLWMHDDYEPIGRLTSASEDDYGLKCAAEVSTAGQGAKVRQLLADKVPLCLSIGFRTKAAMYLDGDESLRTYLASINRPNPTAIAPKWGVRVIQEIELLEVSVVSIPANPNARIDLGKTLFGLTDIRESLRHVRRWSAAAGKSDGAVPSIDPAKLTALAAALRTAAEDLDKLLPATADEADQEDAPDGDEAPAKLLQIRRRAIEFRRINLSI